MTNAAVGITETCNRLTRLIISIADGGVGRQSKFTDSRRPEARKSVAKVKGYKAGGKSAKNGYKTSSHKTWSNPEIF